MEGKDERKTKRVLVGKSEGLLMCNVEILSAITYCTKKKSKKLHCGIAVLGYKVNSLSLSKALPISGRVDRAFAAEAVDLGSIPGWVKPKTIKIGIHSFLA